MAPKRSCYEGEFVTGEGLATLTKLYVKAINDPSCIPNVQTAWETFVREKCDEAKKTALLAYDKIMKAKLSNLPCDGDKILASHQSATDESMTIFREGTFGITTEHTRMDLEELMNDELKKLSEWKANNDRLTKLACEKLLEELKQKHVDPVLRKLRGTDRTSWSFKGIDNGISRIEKEYRNRAVGASKVRAEVFHEFHKRLCAEVDQYKDILKKFKDYDEDILKQRMRYAEKDREAEKLRENNRYMEKQLQIQDQKLKAFEAKKRKELHEKLQQSKETEDILKKKIQDLNKAGMEKQIDNLKYQLGEARNETRKWKSEITGLKNEVARLKEQLRLAQRPFWKRWLGIDS